VLNETCHDTDLVVAMVTMRVCDCASSNDDYGSLVVKARSDLSAGSPDKALVESQKAIDLDPSRWEAYLVAARRVASGEAI